MEYTEQDIDVLGSIEAIRRRPGMYIMGTGSEGKQQLLKEVVDNSVDEYLAGHCSQIVVTVNTHDDIYIVEDNGRGIPTEVHHKTGISTLTTVFTVEHSGGKFGQQAYVISTGMHGVGVKAVNALSEYLNVITVRPDGTWKQEFEKGVAIGEVDPVQMTDRGTGTIVEFKPDPEIFKSVKLRLKRVESWLYGMVALCPGLKLKLIWDGQETLFEGKEGTKTLLEDMLSEDSKAKDDEQKDAEFVTDVIHVDTGDVSVSLAWMNFDGEWWDGYVNTLYLEEGGTHVTGAKKAVTKAIQEFNDSFMKVTPQDLKEGVRGVVHIRLKEPMFKGQSKTRLLNAEADAMVYDIVYKEVYGYLSQYPSIVRDIIRKASDLRRARDQLQQRKQTIKMSGGRKRGHGVLPGKLSEAVNCTTEERELFIVEGESAAGTARRARDKDYQEVLPLRGKIPNAQRFGFDRLMQNQEIIDLMKAIGISVTQVGESDEDWSDWNVDLSRIRVGKVLLLMDADPDGKHISSLAVTLFAGWMWPLIEQGYIYNVESPLFVASYKEHRVFGGTLEELQTQLDVDLSRCVVSRLKGHGEVNEDELAHYAMEPSTRKLTKISCDSIKDVAEDVEKLMGADTSFRKVVLGVE